ncbi:MAG: hypothetical protein ACRBCI_02425 [Cellvibrionaceae bacterium]
MTEIISSSVDDFIEMSDEDTIDASGLESESSTKKADPFIDSRRRLEACLADRQLARDIQEFNFDI